MPEGTKVDRCVHDVMANSHLSKASAIRICQDSTGQSYMTGEKSRKKIGEHLSKHRKA